MTEFISVRQAAEHMRTANGTPPKPATIRVWANQGYAPKGWTGAPLVLRSVRLGVGLATTLEWVQEFEQRRLAIGEQIRQQELAKIAPIKARTERQRRAAMKRAADKLDKLGCG